MPLLVLRYHSFSDLATLFCKKKSLFSFIKHMLQDIPSGLRPKNLFPDRIHLFSAEFPFKNIHKEIRLQKNAMVDFLHTRDGMVMGDKPADAAPPPADGVRSWNDI